MEHPATHSLSNTELAGKIISRLRPYRGRLIASLCLLVASVPFTNFHPLVWGYVADGLVGKTLTPGVLGMWLAVMFVTYVIGAGANAVHSYHRWEVEEEIGGVSISHPISRIIRMRSSQKNL